ncbi:MAG: hypothetical protein H7Y13_12060 [Sphingobacteriaceae bacterium]|nr:hypothetical protein [Sphingobacteriaceae bacterium]
MKLHIGQEIERRFQESGMKLPVFASKINTGDRNVYSLFKRDDINAQQLKLVSEALKFDFFSLYQKEMPESIVREPEPEYQKIRNAITITLNVSGLMDDISKSFPEFLKSVKNEADNYGFRLE